MLIVHIRRIGDSVEFSILVLQHKTSSEVILRSSSLKVLATGQQRHNCADTVRSFDEVIMIFE